MTTRTRNLIPKLVGAFALAMVLGGLAIGALAPESIKHELAEGGIACMFRTITGVPCAFCGMTHATLSLGGGDIAAALRAHMLAPFVLLMFGWAASRLARGKSLSIAGRHVPAGAWLAIIAVFWAAKFATDAIWG